MSTIFNTDNKLFSALDKFINCIYVSMLWVIFCIPVFTIGASTTALYYTVNKVIRHGRSYIWKEFWGAFKENFKQSTILWLILLVVGIVLSLDSYIMYHVFYEAGSAFGKAYVVFVALLIIEIMFSIYVFPYIARFANSNKNVLKNSGLIAVANFPKTLLLFVLFAGGAVITVCFWFLILLMPAVLMWIGSYLLEGIFRKYMSEEDLKLENERNMEYRNGR